MTLLLIVLLLSLCCVIISDVGTVIGGGVLVVIVDGVVVIGVWCCCVGNVDVVVVMGDCADTVGDGCSVVDAYVDERVGTCGVVIDDVCCST